MAGLLFYRTGLGTFEFSSFAPGQRDTLSSIHQLLSKLAFERGAQQTDLVLSSKMCLRSLRMMLSLKDDEPKRTVRDATAFSYPCDIDSLLLLADSSRFGVRHSEPS
jgi:hypothetical protein